MESWKEYRSELPMGLSQALSKNPQALKRFSALSPEQRHSAIQMTHQLHSKQEMEQLANQIADGSLF